jgi:hypothetical protein
MESKHAMVDKAASIHTAEEFFDAYRKRDLDKMVAQCNPEGELRYVPTKVKVRLVQQAEQCGVDCLTPRLI